MIFYAPYGQAFTIEGIPLPVRDAVDYITAVSLVAGDVKIEKDGGTATNITTLPTVTPTGGTSLRISVSATEAQAKFVVIKIIDQTNPKAFEDQTVIVLTFGNASALYPDGTFVTAVSDKTGYSLAADQSGVTIGTVNNIASAQVTAIATAVWASTTRAITDKVGFALTSEQISAISAAVWAEAVRSLTDKADFALSSTNVAAIATAVWSASVRAITDKAGFALTDEQVNAIRDAVWAATVRSLTDKIDFKLASDQTPVIRDSVWGAEARTLTDKAGYSLAADQSGVTVGTVGIVNDVGATVLSKIWGYATRTLSSVGTLVADIWSNSTRSLTGTVVVDEASTTAIRSGLATESGVTGVGTALDAHLTAQDTVLLGIDNAVDNIGAVTSQFVFTIQGKVDATASLGDATVTVDLSSVLNAISAMEGNGFDTSTMSLAALKAKLDAAVQDSAGKVLKAYTVYTDVTKTAVLRDCKVWLTTDAAGTQVYGGAETTDAFGKVYFWLDSAPEGETPYTYYVWRAKEGCTFANPDAEILEA